VLGRTSDQAPIRAIDQAPPERTTGQLPGLEVVGLCMAQSRAGEREFIPCNKAPRPGFLIRGRVIDAVHEPPRLLRRDLHHRSITLPFRDHPGAYPAPFRVRGVFCLDSKPGAGNTRP
jgi:hypothetical protein